MVFMVTWTGSIRSWCTSDQCRSSGDHSHLGGVETCIFHTISTALNVVAWVACVWPTFASLWNKDVQIEAVLAALGVRLQQRHLQAAIPIFSCLHDSWTKKTKRKKTPNTWFCCHFPFNSLIRSILQTWGRFLLPVYRIVKVWPHAKLS